MRSSKKHFLARIKIFCTLLSGVQISSLSSTTIKVNNNQSLNQNLAAFFFCNHVQVGKPLGIVGTAVWISLALKHEWPIEQNRPQPSE